MTIPKSHLKINEPELSRAVVKLKKKVEDLQSKHDGLMKYTEGQKIDIEGLENRLRKAEKHMEHIADCGIKRGDICTCGLNEYMKGEK